MTVIDRSIKSLRLQPGDAVVVNKSFFAISDPYAIYVGKEEGKFLFLVREQSKVGLLKQKKVKDFFLYQSPRRINRFVGDMQTRKQLVWNARRKNDRNSYALLLNHCEDAAGYTKSSSSVNSSAVAGGILGAAALIALAAILLGGDD